MKVKSVDFLYFGRLLSIALVRHWHSLAAGSAVFCLLVGLRPLVTATSTNGNLKIPVLATPSGGGVKANAGNLTLPASSIGESVSAVKAAGAGYSMAGGVIAAAVTYETARKDLGQAHCYPVPFKPSLGHTKITFSQLTRDVEIKIYTLSGQLVRKLVKSDLKDTLEWNATNERGQAVVSGVYLYVVKSVAGKKRGKLMIIR